jgi:hypothetical protein
LSSKVILSSILATQQGTDAEELQEDGVPLTGNIYSTESLKLSLVLAIQEVEKTGSKFIWLLGMFT